MKKFFPALFFFLVFVLGLTLFVVIDIKRDSQTALSLLSIGGNEVRVEIADTPSERLKGLSGKSDIAFGEGMLFVWKESAEHGIWMKGMNFPIDIIWLNENFEVVHIIPYVFPKSYPTVFKSDEPARYVLETKAGFAASIGLLEGEQVTVLPVK